MRLFTPCVVVMLLSSVAPSSAASCSESAANCKASAGAANPQIVSGCEAARAECMKTGTFVGPSTGKMWTNLQKK